MFFAKFLFDVSFSWKESWTYCCHLTLDGDGWECPGSCWRQWKQVKFKVFLRWCSGDLLGEGVSWTLWLNQKNWRWWFFLQLKSVFFTQGCRWAWIRTGKWSKTWVFVKKIRWDWRWKNQQFSWSEWCLSWALLWFTDNTFLLRLRVRLREKFNRLVLSYRIQGDGNCWGKDWLYLSLGLTRKLPAGLFSKHLSAISQKLMYLNRCTFALYFQKVLTPNLRKVCPTLHEFIVDRC